MKLFTLGYEGLSINTYTRLLSMARVTHLFDVREVAWSNRPEFRGFSLKRELLTRNIEYTHLKNAGNPSSNRKTAATISECLDRYRSYIRCLPDVTEYIGKLFAYSINSGQSLCLTCYESDYKNCHRTILIDELNNRGFDFEAIHLDISNLSARGPNLERKFPLHYSCFLAPNLLPWNLK